MIHVLRCHGHTCSQVSQLAVRPFLLSLPATDLWPCKWKMCSRSRRTNSGAVSHQVAQNYLIENRFLHLKCKERSVDCTSALKSVISILRLSRNAVE